MILTEYNAKQHIESEKRQSYRKGERKGERRGERRGRIRMLIDLYREQGRPEEDIQKDLMQRFALNEAEARKYTLGNRAAVPGHRGGRR